MSPVCLLYPERVLCPWPNNPPLSLFLFSCPLSPVFVSLPLFSLQGKYIFIVLRTWCWGILGRYWSLQDLPARNRSLKAVLKGIIVPGRLLSACSVVNCPQPQAPATTVFPQVYQTNNRGLNLEPMSQDKPSL